MDIVALAGLIDPTDLEQETDPR